MFQTTEVPGCYRVVLHHLEYITNWRPDSNILSSMDVVKIMTWKDPCMEFETPKRSGVGLICSNLLRIRKPFPPCYAVWCRECYLPHP